MPWGVGPLISALRQQLIRILGQRKLRTVLVVPFILQLGAAVGLVGYLSFRNGQLAIEELADQRMYEVENRIADRLNAYLAAPHQVNQLNQAALDLGQLNLQNLRSIEPHFWRQSQVFNQISYIQFGHATGEFVGLAVNDDGSFTYQVTEQTGALQTYTINHQGDRGQHLETSPGFDARQRPWYKVPAQKDRPAWTDIYSWVNPPTLAITLGQPYYDQNRQFQGILATDLTISQISDFLRSLDLGQSGRIFIMERSGQLVATSGTAPPFEWQNGKPARLAARHSSDELTRQTSQYLLEHFGALDTILERQEFTAHLDGQRHFMHIMPLRDQHGLDWLSVMVVPESSFMAQIQANTRTTILFCLLAVVLATIVGILRARWVTQPILQLNAAAQKLAAGDFEQTVKLQRTDELGTLSHSFNHMALQLRSAFQKQQETYASLAASERKLAEYNQTLEQQVQQRTQELIQSEKMAVLGQLTAGIGHEINTPLGAIRAAETNITAALTQTLELWPTLIRTLSEQQLKALLQMLDATHTPREMLSSREERQLKRRLKQELEQMGIETAGPIANTLSMMGIKSGLDPYRVILCAANRDAILQFAHDLAMIGNNASNIKIAVDRAAKIVFALKSYARQDALGKKVKASVADTIETVLMLYHHQIKQGTEVSKDFQPVPEIDCYPEELAQVWTNLIHNALQAVEYQGHLEITVAEQQHNIVVSVADSGRGIPLEIQDRIFEPFFTTKPMGEGSGLGLDIVRKIVEKHQGHIELESEPGNTKFSVFLPLLPVS